jgi:hypothetical protein
MCPIFKIPSSSFKSVMRPGNNLFLVIEIQVHMLTIKLQKRHLIHMLFIWRGTVSLQIQFHCSRPHCLTTPCKQMRGVKSERV